MKLFDIASAKGSTAEDGGRGLGRPADPGQVIGRKTWGYARGIMAKGYQDILTTAEAAVQQVSAAELADVLRDHEDRAGLVLVDIRHADEIALHPMLEGAVHAPRGLLEFSIDPFSPDHDTRFAQGKIYIFYCETGPRAVLAAQLAQEMGLMARSLRGGIRAWLEFTAAGQGEGLEDQRQGPAA